jgi:protein-S-isoprenylcysteine O-methyltransferase Ste14
MCTDFAGMGNSSVMKNINKKAFSGLIFLLFVIALTLFLSAWTLNYWRAWTFLVVFGVSVFAITIYLMKNDPKLLERRVQAGPAAEKETIQKFIQSIAGLAFISIFIFSAFDHRFMWSRMSSFLSVIGDVLVVIGLLIVFLVFKENTFTSATIEVNVEQKVVSTGSYSLVRHPMYSGAFIMLIGVPLSLGSWWGLLAVIPLIVVIVLRLLNEEKFLSRNLQGYKEYCQKVRSRLIPFVW